MSHIARKCPKRPGYILLMCLLVIAVSSSVVITLFQALRLQVAERAARENLVVSNSVLDGAYEHAVAILLDQPTFRGSIGIHQPSGLSPDSHAFYTAEVQDAAGGILVLASVETDLGKQVSQHTFTSGELSTRRALLGLSNPANGGN